jgi:protein-tyrosine phosphatase
MNSSKPFYAQIKDNLYFGKYPSLEQRNELIKLDIKYFVNLTDDISYAADIHFPITDGGFPDEDQLLGFAMMIEMISKQLNQSKVYVHCRNGRGRSVLVIASLLHLHYGVTSVKACLDLINQAHQSGHGQKWTKSIPTHRCQIDWIRGVYS